MALVGCPSCPGEDVNVLMHEQNRWRRLCSCERKRPRRCTRCTLDADYVVFRNCGNSPLPPLPRDSSSTVQFVCSVHSPGAPPPVLLPPEVPQPLLQPTGLGGIPGPPPTALPDPHPYHLLHSHRMHDHHVMCTGCGREHLFGHRLNFSGSTSECPHCHGHVFDAICFQDSCACASCCDSRTSHHAHAHRVPQLPETF